MGKVEHKSPSGSGRTASARTIRIGRILLGLIITAALAACTARFVYRRLTIMPPTLEEAYAIYGPIEVAPQTGPDVTGELAKILDALSVYPVFNLPAPEGMRWEGDDGNTLDIDEVFRKPWDRELRPYLVACVSYLNSPPVADALNSANQVLDGSVRLSHRGEPDDLFSIPRQSKLRRLATLLCARARYYLAELGDQEGAIKDLETCLWLGQACAARNEPVGFYVGAAVEELALTELQRLSCEAALEDGLLQRIDRRIAERRDPRTAWGKMMHNELVQLLTNLRARYAGTGDDQGWLVLSTVDNPWNAGKPWRAQAHERSPLWNVTTVFHNDFATVAGKYRRLFAALDCALPDSLPDCEEAFASLEDNIPQFTSLDGPYDQYLTRAMIRRDFMHECRAMYRLMAQRSMTRVALAIHRYRALNGTLPDSLDRLARELLSAVPLNPMQGEPFEYLLLKHGCFELRAPAWKSNDYDPTDIILSCCPERGTAGREDAVHYVRLVRDTSAP